MHVENDFCDIVFIAKLERWGITKFYTLSIGDRKINKTSFTHPVVNEPPIRGTAFAPCHLLEY